MKAKFLKQNPSKDKSLAYTDVLKSFSQADNRRACGQYPVTSGSDFYRIYTCEHLTITGGYIFLTKGNLLLNQRFGYTRKPKSSYEDRKIVCFWQAETVFIM